MELPVTQQENNTPTRGNRGFIRIVYIGVFLIVLFGAAVDHIPSLLTVDDPLTPAPTAIILSLEKARIDYGISLYKNGTVSNLVMFAGDAYDRPTLKLLTEDIPILSVYNDMIDYATRHAGIPRTAFQIHGFVSSTYDEARMTERYCNEHTITKLIVVTSSYHTRRAQYIFRKVLEPHGITVMVTHPTPETEELNIDRWYAHEKELILYLTECIKYIYYRIHYH